MARQGVYQQTGNIIDFVNTGGNTINAGQIVPLGTRIGFAVADIAPGAVGGVAVQGVFTGIPAETTAAFDVGDVVYWSDTDAKLTKTAVGDMPVAGWCVAPKAISGTVATIKLTG